MYRLFGENGLIEICRRFDEIALSRRRRDFFIATARDVLYISTCRHQPQPEIRMDFSLRIRLSIMMFLQYFVWGAWAVAFGTFVSALPTQGGFLFPGDAVGWLYATSNIGAMISPLFIGLFADRLFATEKVLAVFHIVGAGLLGVAAWLCQTHLPETTETFLQLAKQEKVVSAEVRQAIAELDQKKKEIKSLNDEKLKAELQDEIDKREKLAGEVLATAPNLAESLERQEKLEADLAKTTDEAKKKDLQKLLDDVKADNDAAITKVKETAAYKAVVHKTYYPLLWIMLAYALFYMPTLTLTNSISFRNMSDPDKHFGSIRVLGTIGWIAAGVIVGFSLNAISPQPLYLAAVSSLALGFFCFLLPHTPPSLESKGIGDTLGLPALAMLKSVPFLVFFICSFLLMIPLAFYYSWANKFLTDIKAPYPTALQTIGQVSEIFFMLAIPFCLRRFGTKGMLLIGMGAWVLRYAVFASMNVPLVIAIGLPLHGICYDFFFVVSYLYVDRKAPKHLRASAQGIITFITLGVGQYLGNYFGGKVKVHFELGDTIKYQEFWLVPLAVAAAATVLFALLFHDKTADAVAGSTGAGKVPDDDYDRRFGEQAPGQKDLIHQKEDRLQK
jgi:nucleoside transporter